MEIPSEGVPMNLNLKSLALVNLGTNFSLRYVSKSLRINSKIWVKTQNECVTDAALSKSGGGGGSNMVDIICPPGSNRVN